MESAVWGPVSRGQLMSQRLHGTWAHEALAWALARMPLPPSADLALPGFCHFSQAYRCQCCCKPFLGAVLPSIRVPHEPRLAVDAISSTVWLAVEAISSTVWWAEGSTP